MSNNAFQFESDNGVIVELSNGSDDSPFADMRASVATSRQSDFDELEIYDGWKEQMNDRFGPGSPAPR